MGIIREDQKDHLIIDHPVIPIFHGLPKVHKNISPPPLRPIIAGIHLLNERVSEWVDSLLQPLIQKIPGYLRDTKQVLKTFQNFKWESDLMVSGNNITSIVLLGFPSLQHFRFLFFSLLIVGFLGTISGNLLIMVLYAVSKSLRSPMYFFITQLSLCDLLVTMDIVPVLLRTVLYGRMTMTLVGCITQFSIFATSESSECLLLSVMSYDRYVAICNPLHYHSIMSRRFCGTSVSINWLIGFIASLVDVNSVNSSHFCGPNVIDHFYCDIEPIMHLTCSELSVIHKVFLGGDSLTLSKVLSLMYTVLIPLLNPIIYTLKNKDFKDAFQKLKGMSPKMTYF
ncbi:olfactory receptor 4B13-like [Leptodactylus fuscus]|uniref:olfactory receptor 4B13-like n=1 Tax=Leptodactylus fuscus TaxID=238119 RepID=UPI003F4E747F